MSRHLPHLGEMCLLIRLSSVSLVVWASSPFSISSLMYRSSKPWKVTASRRGRPLLICSRRPCCAPRFRSRTIVLDRSQSYGPSRSVWLLPIPIAEYPYRRAFDPFPKFKRSKLIAVTCRQLVLPSPVSFSVRIASGKRRYVRPLHIMLLTWICRNSAAVFGLTVLSQSCGASLCSCMSSMTGLAGFGIFRF